MQLLHSTKSLTRYLPKPFKLAQQGIYWEESGTRPLLYSHGGPGAGLGSRGYVTKADPCLLDVSGPLRTAWEVHRRWQGSQLIIDEGEGHGGPSMVDAWRQANDEMASRLLAEMERSGPRDSLR